MTDLQPWHWRSLPLNHKTGSEIFERLFYRTQSATQSICTLLESPAPNPADHESGAAAQSPLTKYSICAGGPRQINGRAQVWTPPVGQILSCLDQRLQHQLEPELPADIAALPFTGGWLGWLGYDLAWEIETLPRYNPNPLPFPVAYWYEPECFAILDHWSQVLWLAATTIEQLDNLQHQVEKDGPFGTKQDHPSQQQSSQIQFQTTAADYQAAVRQAKAHIQAGDIFQANLSARFQAHTTKQSWTIYRALQRINPSPFASYWQTPWGAVVSCSPERLIQLRDRQAQTRPIAGTRPRGMTTSQDQAYANTLSKNAKENAEHIMLVDLERNDLGRVCEWGSIDVNELLIIERYSHVMHLVSNVVGRLRSEVDAIDLIRAVFPGGTITGCPKVRCMEIIEELEPLQRNLFYGSCGYLDWRGNLDLNILIRTLLVTPTDSSQTHDLSQSNLIWGQVGAGIVADSDPQQEWDESLQKAKAQLLALGLET